MKNSLKVKITISIVSIILTFVFIEIGLRMAGFFVYSWQNKEYIPSESSYVKELRYKRDNSYELYKTNNAAEVVLCIGDSFTNGGNVRSFQTYPYYLFNMLNDTGMNKIVLNMGKCEDSTFGVYQRLKRYLEKIKDKKDIPGIIVIFTGNADKYNLAPEMSKSDMPVVHVDWHDNTVYWYQKLRLYKLFRYIRLALTSQYLIGDIKEKKTVTEKDIQDYLGMYEDLKSIECKYRETINAEDTVNDIDLRMKYFKDVEKLGKNFKNKIKQHFSAANNEYNEVESFDQVLNSISTALVIFYAAKKRHDEAIGLILDVERNYPDIFWTSDNLSYLRYNLFQIFQMQSKYTSDDIITQIQISMQKAPHITENKDFTKFHNLITNWDELDKYVDEKRLLTWDEIINLCRSYNMKIIMQNYPTEYKSANNIIKQVSEKYNIPLIDNESIFRQLVEESGREKYLEDDDHCSPEGYQILAKNVFDKIVELDQPD